MTSFAPAHRRACRRLRPLLLATCLSLPVLSLPPLPAAAQLVLAPLGSNVIPDSLTQDDITVLTTASAKLYTPDAVTVGAVETWVNPKTGNSGTVTLIRVFEHDGMPCRQIVHRLKLIHHGEQVYTFNRCRIATGEWKLLG